MVPGPVGAVDVDRVQDPHARHGSVQQVLGRDLTISYEGGQAEAIVVQERIVG